MSKVSKEKKKQLYGKTNNALPEQDISQKVEQVLASRRGPREAKEEKFQKETKFVVLYKDEEGNVDSRWTYDLKKFPYGPISVEEFGPQTKGKFKKS